MPGYFPCQVTYGSWRFPWSRIRSTRTSAAISAGSSSPSILNAAANDFNSGPLMADGEQSPSRALRVMRCERRTPQQFGGLVAVVLRVDVKREQVIELGRGAGHDLRQFLPCSGQPILALLALRDVLAGCGRQGRRTGVQFCKAGGRPRVFAVLVLLRLGRQNLAARFLFLGFPLNIPMAWRLQAWVRRPGPRS